MNMLAEMSWPQFGLTVLMIGLCVLLMIVVMLQRGRGQGLAGAFGGGGGGGAFGAKTGDVFTWITVSMAIAFLLLNVVGNFVLDQTPLPPTVADATDMGISIVPPGDAPATGDGKPSITLDGKATGSGEPIEVKLGGPAQVPPAVPSTGSEAPGGSKTPSDAGGSGDSGGSGSAGTSGSSGDGSQSDEG